MLSITCQDQNTSLLYKKILSASLTFPEHLSPEAVDLLKRILNTEPTVRYTLADIKKHAWFQDLATTAIPPGIIVSTDQIPVDFGILQQVVELGFNLDFGQKCIESNKHNHATTVYYLLLKKYIL